MAISKNFIVTDGLDVGTSANIGTSLVVGGITTLGNNVSVNGSVNVSGSINVTNNLVSSGTMSAPTVNVGNVFIANSSSIRLGNTSVGYGIQANGSLGQAGFLLTSNGSAVYWAAPLVQGITNLVAANGINGGTITSTGSISVNANTGLVSNTSGVHVNTAFIATLQSNTTAFVGSTPAANIVTASMLSGNLTNYAALSGAIFSGSVSVPSSFTVRAEGVEGGQIILKKGTGMTTGGDVYIDTIASGVRIYDNNGTTFPQFFMNLSTGSFSGPGGTFWHSGNGGVNSALDAGLFEGEPGSYYTDIPGRLGYTPVQQGGGVGQGSNKIRIGWLSNSLGLQVDSNSYGNTWPINVNGTAGGVAWENVSSRPTGVSSFTNDSGYITNAGRAFPRKSTGGDINFIWSGQEGQPSWVWGGNNGTDMYVYNPSQFSVSYAGSAGNADTVDGWHADGLRQWGNLIGIPPLVYASQFSQSISIPGWCKLPNGLMFQWGTINNVNGDSYGSASMPTSWPVRGFAVYASRYSGIATGGGGSVTANFSSYGTKTGVVVDYNNIFLFNGEDVTSNFYFFAIGY